MAPQATKLLRLRSFSRVLQFALTHAAVICSAVSKEHDCAYVCKGTPYVDFLYAGMTTVNVYIHVLGERDI